MLLSITKLLAQMRFDYLLLKHILKDHPLEQLYNHPLRYDEKDLISMRCVLPLLKHRHSTKKPFLKRNANSFHLVAFLHRCSKLIRTSYTAGPSILQCKSCHGCLRALVPEGNVGLWKSPANTVSQSRKSQCLGAS